MDFYSIFTILSGVFLFGSLWLSILTDDTTYFIWGYPIAVVLLIIAALHEK